MYDGFISYSHAADDLLAPRLQSALQRFAKPWWKRRAVRIFRDESSLSANPHLWSSITEALDTSGWFVLLLSPDAAQSEWVNQEIAYWVEERDPKKILPVVTDGEFGWFEGAASGDSVPDSLLGVFTEEPRWVDVRWARGEDQLDLKDPRFADAIADIASTIRGVPKDELAGEEVRQHRRTVRTAWSAGAALVVLSVAAVWAAVFALGQRAEAERQAEMAQANEAVAERQTEIAQAGEAEAIRAAAIAEGRRLVAASLGLGGNDPELGLLLALEALHVMPEGDHRGEAIAALRAAASEHRLVARIPHAGGIAAAQVSPDGALLIHASQEGGRLIATDIESGEQVWEYLPPSGTIVFPLVRSVGDVSGTHQAISISPDGSLVAVIEQSGNGPGRVVVLSTDSGEVVTTLSAGECSSPHLARGFSPDGESLVVYGGEEPCATDGHLLFDGRIGMDDLDTFAANGRAYVFSVGSWEVENTVSDSDRIFEGVQISASGQRALVTSALAQSLAGESTVVAYPGLDPLSVALDADVAALAPNGSVLALADPYWGPYVQIIDAAASETFFTLNSEIEVWFYMSSQRLGSLAFSPNSELVSVLGAGFAVLDVDLGQVVFRSYKRTPAYDHSWTADSAFLVTTRALEIQVWAVAAHEKPVPVSTEYISDSELPGRAALGLTRGLTGGECRTFLIDPCPTLDEMRSR